MLKVSSKILVGLLLASVAISCSQSEINENVLAKINDLEVTEAHFESAFKRYYYKSGQSLEPTYTVKSSVLDTEFNVYVLATYARQLGIDELNETKKMQGMIRRRVLTEEYLTQNILSNVEISDDDIRQMYLKFNTQLKASHLYTPTKEKADSLYKLLEQGSTFEELAGSVFQNKRLAESGGDLGLFTVDEMDVAFEKTAYGLKIGEISKPVKTAQGYSIIKLTDRITKPILTEYEFAVHKNQLAYFVDKQEKEMATRNHMYHFLENLDINSEMLTDIWQSIQNNYTAFQSSDPEFLSTQSLNKQSVLASYKSFDITIEDFREELGYTPAENLNNVQDVASFTHFVKGIAYRTYLLKQALDANLDKTEEVRASIDQTYYVYLAQRAEDAIRNDIEITEDELEKAYYENPSKYIKPLELDLSRIVVSTEDEAKDILQQLNNGSSFTEMVQQLTIRNEERLTDGRLGYEFVQNYGFISPKLSQLQPGDLSGVILFQTGEYHIYKCLGRKEVESLSFKQAKAMVRSELGKKKFKEHRSEIIEQVKRRHEAVVNTQKLKELTIQI
ncbi:MAG: peptidylprolyl isomerase [Balneolaceae bacterium]